MRIQERKSKLPRLKKVIPNNIAKNKVDVSKELEDKKVNLRKNSINVTHSSKQNLDEESQTLSCLQDEKDSKKDTKLSFSSQNYI